MRSGRYRAQETVVLHDRGGGLRFLSGVSLYSLFLYILSPLGLLLKQPSDSGVYKGHPLVAGLCPLKKLIP